MVCCLGGGHMTTLLEGRTTSQIMAEDAGCWKLAAQYIQREFKEADEPNLLDEEDMDVYGLRPMVDPLILVSCKSCKKPVKISRYADHAETCKSLSSLVDCATETEVAAKKKPPRKEKKKLQISNSSIRINLFVICNICFRVFLQVVFVELNSNIGRVASVGKPERRAIATTAPSNSYAVEQIPKETSFPSQPKGEECVNESQARSLKNFDSVNSYQTHTKHNDHHLQTNGMLNVPAPLATKIFYSQRNQRLRSAISQMYYRSSSTQHDHDFGNMQFSETDRHREKDGH